MADEPEPYAEEPPVPPPPATEPVSSSAARTRTRTRVRRSTRTEQAVDVTDSATLAAEVERLQAENERLSVEHEERRRNRVRGGLRSSGVVVLLVLATVLALLTPPLVWGRNLLLNTDRYVSTLKPIASDPGVQAGIVKAVEQQIDANLDVDGLVTDALDQLPSQAAILASPISGALSGFINTVVTRFVQSDAFQTLWVTINTEAHTALVEVLTGRDTDGKAVTVRGDSVVLNLAPVVQQVKAQLVSAGLTVADKIPVVGATIEIAKVKGINSARTYVRLLNNVANWLPWLTLLVFGGAIALARRHRHTLVVSALCIAGAMLVLRIGIAVGRAVYLHELPGLYLSHDASGFMYDTLFRYLIDGIRTIFILSVIVALVGVAFGPGDYPVRFRAAVQRGPQAIGARWGHTPFGQWVGRWRVPLMWGVGVLAALILLIAQPTLVAVLVVLGITAVVLLLISGLGRQAGIDPSPPPDDAAAAAPSR